MGLFSSHKKPPAPVPSMDVHLAASEDTMYHPDDNVSGHIALSTPFPLTPQAIEVSLWGQAKVWIRTNSSGSNNSTNYQHYRDDAPLFSVTFNMMPNPHELVPDQIYNFPFNFRVPRGTGFDRSDCYKNAHEQPYMVTPHDLPPTFFFGHSEDSPDHASIAYGVTARLICPGVGVGKEQEAVSSTKPILFQPLNPNALIPEVTVVRFPKNFTVQSSSLTGSEPSSIGFRKRIHDRFSSSTPKMDFELGIEVPDRLNASDEFSFRTSFAVLNKSDNVTYLPSVNFTISEIKLLDFTFFRAQRDWSASNTMSGWQHKNYRPGKEKLSLNWQQDIYREKKVLLNSIPASQLVELKEVPVLGEKDKKILEQEEKCEVWFKARVPGFTPPSFQSFAISRMYRVKIKLVVEIGEKKFPYEVESHVQHLGA
ncbi:hypothetical protein EJ04DRAFT_508232 [Polyplosphaeria fusca]|uniref:Arrestin-like N-terminal domain-containing protein n=1 Tax=Polyplosphaeria fusca TaxID=682080 RepID=A0A9P4V848_9PLEO|nr:hypothetical protein EJ04DRAFT_508232 [Polyplosphaeria fusca]